MKKIQDDIKGDETFWHNKPRLGLFSYTASNSPGAIRDSSESERRIDRWKVKLDPKNFATGRSGLFAKSGFLSENVKFVETSNGKTWRGDNSDSKKVQKNAFKTGNFPKGVKGPYDYMPHSPKEGPMVGFGKRGMYSPGPKSGMGNHTYGHLFQKFTYSEDAYDNKKMDEAKDRESSLKKRGGRGAFSSTSRKRDFFSSNKDLYARPDNLTASPDTDRDARSTPKLNQKAFVPSGSAKQGYNRTFTKFPEYMSDPLPIIDPDRDRKKEKIWRTTYKSLTGPSVSVKQYNRTFRPTGKL